MLKIAERKALDAHRARARRALPLADVASCDGGGAEPLHARPTGERLPRPSQADRALWDAVARLPERQRSAVVLRFVGDLAHADIAAAIGCSEEAARRSLLEGLTKLRKAVVA